MDYKFLIYISYSYAVPIGLPLEKEILSRNFTVKWFADQADGKKAISKFDNKLETIQDVLKYEPHIILAATDSVPDFINALRVQVFHGFNAQKRPSKKNTFSHFRIRGFFDLYCTQGPSTTQGFKSQAEKHPHFEVIETGWSKVDPLFPIPEHTPSKPPTVFVASTFTERLSLALNNDVFEEIKRLSGDGKFHFKMVLHPKIPKDVVNKWKTIDNPNFEYFQTTDLIPLMQESDIMLSDTTSAIQEFLLLERPVVAINHTFDHGYLINISDASEIENALVHGLTYPEALMTSIRSFLKELHPYSDGQSSKRIVDASLTFLHQDKSHLKPKPLNLMRKYKMRKRLNHYTLRSYNKPFTIKLPN